MITWAVQSDGPFAQIVRGDVPHFGQVGIVLVHLHD
jgi:hypothetical protein